VLLYFSLGIVCLYILILKVRHMLGFPDPGENRQKRTISRRYLKTHIELLQNLETWTKLIVAILVIVATELTIDWNNIEGVNSLSGAGQTFPFFIKLGAVLRIVYVTFRYSEEDSEDGSDDSYRTGEPIPPTRPLPLPVHQIPQPAYELAYKHHSEV
jgi:hypothetical protein